MEPNFSGFVSKANLLCADGRTIRSGAFKHQDGLEVPLVYQHNHDDINQVLGKVMLTDKPGEGTWGDVYLNGTPSAKNADALVKHGDIKKFSIWAKDLVEQGMDVLKGEIQEVSLVLAGSNAGANIANYQNVLAHSGLDEDEVLLVIGGEIEHSTIVEDKKVEEAPKVEDKATEDAAKDTESEAGDKTVAEVLGTLSDEQQTAVNSVIDDIVTEAVTEALTEAPELEHSDTSKKGPKMSRNIFDRSTEENNANNSPELKHSDVVSVLTAAKGNPGEGVRGFDENNAVGSLRQFIRSAQGKELMHADTYGIQNMEVLFPDAQKLMNTPTFVDRRQEWVKTFISGTSKSPFSRVKTVYADITADEARAKGYIKANQKVEEVFPVFKRETGPAWIYKKQKLDRQDIIDIVDFDVVAWMKVEMRGKLDEEIARAGLFGDGRPTMIGGNMNPDKIPDPGAANNSGNGIRAIANDNDLYAGTFNIAMPAVPTGTDWNLLLDGVTEASEFYMGSGNKTAFMSFRVAAKLLTIRDAFGHRVYRNLSEVAGDMDVAKIERVPTELMPAGVLAIVLDLKDYNFGMGRGGEVTLFDDFDIDFNQYKYLIETYLSGGLVLPYSAQIFKQTLATDPTLVPTKPAIAANIITIPTQTGVAYKRMDTGATVAAAATITLDAVNLKQVEIEATPTAGYQFKDNLDQHDAWKFYYKAP